jgi:hypothetical protein
MAYTTIDKPTDYFETKIFTGNGSSKYYWFRFCTKLGLVEVKK